jgi:hypothetical protein
VKLMLLYFIANMTTAERTTSTVSIDWQRSKGLVRNLALLRQKDNFKLSMLKNKPKLEPIKKVQAPQARPNSKLSNRSSFHEPLYKAGTEPIYLIPLMPDKKDEEKVGH